MSMPHELDQEFLLYSQALLHAVSLMGKDFDIANTVSISAVLQESGLDSIQTLGQLTLIVLCHAARLGAPTSFARECAGITEVVASDSAHLSIKSLQISLLGSHGARVSRNVSSVAWR